MKNLDKIQELATWIRFTNWIKTDSSNIAEMKWVANNEKEKLLDNAIGVMTVEFKSGARYEYRNVPQWLFEEILMSDSVGSSFFWNVREQPDVYPYKQI